jgi:hypothetical protein
VFAVYPMDVSNLMNGRLSAVAAYKNYLFVIRGPVRLNGCCSLKVSIRESNLFSAWTDKNWEHNNSMERRFLDKVAPMVLREETLKILDETGKVDHKTFESEANFHSFYGSLVERYKRNQIALHLHLLGGNSSFETCIVCQCGQIVTSGFEPTIPGHNHFSNRERTKFGEKQPSVLVDVCEFIQNGETRCAGLPVVVRLKRFNERNGNGIDSLQAVTSLSVLKTVGCETDGEHVLFVGCVVRNKNKFPDEIIERRPQVLETIPNEKPDFFGNGEFGLNDKGGLILAAICIWHEFAWIRVKVPLNLGFNEAQVQFCVINFLSDTFQ